ncbi:MAG: hypothetical protein IJF97_00760 [Eggerthellaceae bacterium]|nr:hypothetical protein [Eggerthellaceae bacterium]MBQ3342677.1 hypothetical protein [Kiritimatiellia bacterium]
MTLANRLRLASALGGGGQKIPESSAPSTKRTSATAVGSSVDGYVTVEFDDGTQMEVPTIASVEPGDEVQLLLDGADIIALGSGGWGDRMADTAMGAQTAGDEAAAIANATNQHFWADDNGAHVSTAAGEATGGKNTVWNTEGMLFRNGTNPLLALIASNTGGLKIYNGMGREIGSLTVNSAGSLIIEALGSLANALQLKADAATATFDINGFNISAAQGGVEANGLEVLGYDWATGQVLGTSDVMQGDGDPLVACTIANVSVRVPASGTIAKGSGASNNVTLTDSGSNPNIPAGYKAISVVGWETDHEYAFSVNACRLTVSNKQLHVSASNNHSTTAYALNVTVKILCVREGLYVNTAS